MNLRTGLTEKNNLEHAIFGDSYYYVIWGEKNG